MSPDVFTPTALITKFDEGQHHPRALRQWCTCIGLLVGLLSPACVMAQTGISIPVTVSTSPSQQQIVTLGASAITVGTLELIELQNIDRYIRQSERYEQNLAQTAALRPFQIASLAPVASGSNGGGFADFARLNAFSNLDYRFGHYDVTANTPAHDFDHYGLLIGTDYRINPGLVAGVSFGYQHSTNEFDGFSGHADANEYSLAGFGSWYPIGSWYVDGIVRGGIGNYDTRRPVPGGTAHGDPDGHQLSLSVGTGYDLAYGALTVEPSLRVNYLDAAIDPYTEQALANGLAYRHQDARSLTTNLGGTITRAVDMHFGVLLPQASFEWVHEFEGEMRHIVASPAAGGPSFIIPVDAQDRTFYRAAVGITATLPHGRMLFAHYEAELGKAHQNVNTFTIGLRLEL